MGKEDGMHGRNCRTGCQITCIRHCGVLVRAYSETVRGGKAGEKLLTCIQIPPASELRGSARWDFCSNTYLRSTNHRIGTFYIGLSSTKSHLFGQH